MGFWVLRLGVPRALLALLEPFFFWPGDLPLLFAPSDEPVDGVALAAEFVAVVVEGDTWRVNNREGIHWIKVTIIFQLTFYCR